jgi:hypothetical protein
MIENNEEHLATAFDYELATKFAK